MDSRPTKEITLTGTDKKITLYTYITGREKRELDNVFLKDVGKVKVGHIDQTEIDVGAADTAQDAAFRLVVRAIDGKEDGVDGFNIVSEILDLPNSDFQQLIGEINKVTSGESFLAGGKS